MGDYNPILSQHPNLFAFSTTYEGKSNTVLVNTSSNTIEVDDPVFSQFKAILLQENASLQGTLLALKPYGILISKT